MHFYWHNTREKQDNHEVWLWNKNKPEILHNKIEALPKFYCVKLKVYFCFKAKPRDYPVFLAYYVNKSAKKTFIIIKIFLTPFIVKFPIVVYTRKKLFLNLKRWQEKKYLPHLNQLFKLWIDIELKLLRICAVFYGVKQSRVIGVGAGLFICFVF